MSRHDDEGTLAQIIGADLETQSQDGNFARTDLGNEIERPLDLADIAARDGFQHRQFDILLASPPMSARKSFGRQEPPYASRLKIGLRNVSFVSRQTISITSWLSML